MKTSESIVNLSKALFTFQQQCGKISKEASNPFFKSKYASLSNILDSIREPLEKSGLCFSQFPDENGLTTILIHNETGEYMMATSLIKTVKEDPQSLGSAITYMRRYALGAILGLNIDEDDDGNKASGLNDKPSTPTKELPWLPDVKVQGIVDWAKKEGKTFDVVMAELNTKYRVNKNNEERLKIALNG
jgi:hypothetical protein